MRGERAASNPRRRLPSRLSASLHSLRNRLALLIFAVTLIAIGTLYIYVSPGLRSRLINERVNDLALDINRYSGEIAKQIKQRQPNTDVRDTVDIACLESNDRVSWLEASSSNPRSAVLTARIDSSSASSAQFLTFPVAYTALRSGQPASGTEQTVSGIVAEAALPVRVDGEIKGVIVFSAPVDDLVHSVRMVRNQILIAGGLALLLALIGGYLTAMWLARRVKRIERAAERVAAGEFGRPIPVDSKDELGQLTIAFNDMQEQLTQLDKARKQFIATASHELRTPVFSLGGFVELLEDDELDPDTRKRFLGHVTEQVERLHKLSVNLLDLSRLDAGALELRPEQVDVAELAASVSAEFELAAAEHDSEIELNVAPRTEAQCDPVRLAQIVRILIDNALHHNPVGTMVTVDAARSDGNLLVAVRDDGDGIPRAAMSRIFEPFFTADDARGSGLGLAIASELAERMDGRLTVTSRPGETVFHLQLPAGDTHTAAAEISEPDLA